MHICIRHAGGCQCILIHTGRTVGDIVGGHFDPVSFVLLFDQYGGKCSGSDHAGIQIGIQIFVFVRICHGDDLIMAQVRFIDLQQT